MLQNNWLMLLAVHAWSYGCTWEVWRALKKLELLSAAPQATLTLLSCSFSDCETLNSTMDEVEQEKWRSS